MTFRSKLFWIFSVALLVCVALITAAVTFEMRRAHAEWNGQQSDAVIENFEHQFEQRRQEVARRVQAVADAEATIRMAIELSQPHADVTRYFNDARGVSASHKLDFLDFVDGSGTIFSSAESPSRAGSSMAWVTQSDDWAATGSFLTKMDTPDGPALGLLAVSTLRVGDKNIYVVGGERLDKSFLSTLAVPAGVRALLYLNLDSGFQDTDLMDQSGPVVQGERLGSFVSDEIRRPRKDTFTISWTSDRASTESFSALPLLGRQNDLLALLLVGSSERAAVAFERRLFLVASIVAGAGLLLGVLLSWWGTASVTRPARRIAEGVRKIAQGNWDVRVESRARGDVGQLARDFNRMAEDLRKQREVLLQAEHVAAWRDVTRGLSREIEKAAVPLQTAAETFQRAKDQNPELLDEVARATAGSLESGVASLRAVAGRFNNFAKEPQLAAQAVNLNEIVRGAVKLFEPQFSAVGRPRITPELHLDEDLPPIQADPALLQRAVENLVLNAMEAMPGGGVLMLRTTRQEAGIGLEVADTGAGLTTDEREKIFTPGYTMKQHGADMGLAVVQAIVSDHGGRLSVESEPGVGTSFHVHLPSKALHRPVSSVSVAGQGKDGTV